jgi:hypothetical protein
MKAYTTKPVCCFLMDKLMEFAFIYVVVIGKTVNGDAKGILVV